MAGTSNWQNIGYCVDVIMRISPASLLDVGVGFGRWGMLAREFCELWQQRVFSQQWTTRIDGIEAFAPNIAEHHRHFYNEIMIGDAGQLATPELCAAYDLIVLGDVVEHLERAAADQLLATCIAHARYVMVNIPLGPGWEQSDIYGNDFERHRSTWQADDFRRPELRHWRLFRDFAGRLFGTFVFSREDPRELRNGLYSSYEGPASAVPDARELEELSAVLASRTWRVVRGLRRSLPWRVIRRVRRMIARQR